MSTGVSGGSVGQPPTDPVVTAMSRLVPGGVVRGIVDREQGRQVRWIQAGTARPPIVLVAGAGEVGLDWAVILPALAEQCHVIAYDRAGLGASDRATRLTLDSQVHDLVALLDAVGPAVLVGHSWGGLLAELATLARPDRVLGLVLVDPFHEAMTADVPPILRAVSSLMLNGVVLLKAVGLFPRIAAKIGWKLAERCTDDLGVRALLAEAYVASYATIGQVAMIRAENRLAHTCTREVRAARTRSAVPDVPMRLLTATRGKPPALQQRAHQLTERTAANFPRGEHVVVPDSGHYIHKDQPSAVITAIGSVVTTIRQESNP